LRVEVGGVARVDALQRASESHDPLFGVAYRGHASVAASEQDTDEGVLIGGAILEFIEEHVGVGLAYRGVDGRLLLDDCQRKRKEVVVGDGPVLHAGGGHGVVGVKSVGAGQHSSVAVDDSFGERMEGVAVQSSGQTRSAAFRDAVLQVACGVDLERNGQYPLGIAASAGPQ
jgi:hypothetical protein